MDVFVDDFLGLAQGPWHCRRHVRHTLFHAFDKVFRPLERQDNKHRKEVLSLKKLEAVDCPCSKCQNMLRWIVDSVNIRITLLSHRVAWLKEIFSPIPRNKHKVGMDMCHRVLGKMRSMALSLPGARGVFSLMKESICHVKGKSVTLSTGVHEAL